MQDYRVYLLMCQLIDVVQPAVWISRDYIWDHVFTCWKIPDPSLSEGEGSLSARNTPGIPTAGHFAQVASAVVLRYRQGGQSRTAEQMRVRSERALDISLTWRGPGSFSWSPRITRLSLTSSADHRRSSLLLEPVAAVMILCLKVVIWL